MWPVDAAVDVRSTRTVTAVGTTADTGCSQARITAAAWLLGPVAAADTMAAIGQEQPVKSNESGRSTLEISGKQRRHVLGKSARQLAAVVYPHD